MPGVAPVLYPDNRDTEVVKKTGQLSGTPVLSGSCFTSSLA